MKKSITFILAAILVLSALTIGVSAKSLEDGTYEIPVILMHKEKEKESFGNKYLLQTALMKVEGGSKTLTILLGKKVEGSEFSYYVNGGLDGEVKPAKELSSVTIKGQKYDQAFEFPMKAENDIGLKFKVPGMPMTPSARLRLDYDNMVLVSSAKAPAPAKTEPAKPAPEKPSVTETKPAETTTSAVAAEAVTTEVRTSTVTETEEQITAEVSADTAEDAKDEKKSVMPAVIIILIVAAAAVVCIVIVIKHKQKAVTENDK